MRTPILASLLLLTGTLTWADVMYTVTVDTSSINGATGNIDLQFNGGSLTSQFANATISSFMTDGMLAGSPMVSGDVNGVLPSTLTFDNQGSFNDYFEGFTYGSTLTFDLSLYGPAITMPNGTSDSGSTFGLAFYTDMPGLMPVLTTDPMGTGNALTVDINLDGTVTPMVTSSELTLGGPGASVPEPGEPGLIAMGVLFAIVLRRARLGQ